MKKNIILGFGSVLLAATSICSCTPKSSKGVTASNTNLEIKVYQDYISNYNAQSLEEGKTLMENNCGKCHKLKPLANYNIAKWDKVLDRMIPKAKLSSEDGNKVRAYIYSQTIN
jgi:cytochrome c1